ncbi:HNH endonuclease signature motif containing protein [Microbacterium sp. ZXX196]|uniref:HNH endonuclease signature motif containing protein n=1 Tax=Microbacterium sp. ZXX196 TaxID=2609291 RepID=UPI0018ACB4D8|nr:HNH endonuclease signature motif containing protein [Microbacterium sp. ZXX196]
MSELLASVATRDEIEQAERIVSRLAVLSEREARIRGARAALMAEAFAITRSQTERLAGATMKERQMPLRSMAADIAAHTRATDRAVQNELGAAHFLVTSFPETHKALAAGEIHAEHAETIASAGVRLTDPEERAAFEGDTLGVARQTTAHATRTYARQAAERLAPLTPPQQRAHASEGRRVFVDDYDQGASMLGIIGPSAEIHGVFDRITRQARVLRDDAARAAREAKGARERRAAQATSGTADSDAPTASPGGPPPAPISDERTLAQTRADLALDMLLSGTPGLDHATDTAPGGLGAIRAHVQVTIPVTTITGATSTSADLDGACLVDPDSARRLAGGATGWDRLLTDPVTGTVVATDRYTPTAAQQRYLRARDQHCRFPGCRQPARRCDIDHTIDHARGGPTSLTNLACLCKRHHTLKHATEWHVSQGPGGHLTWTSPTGASIADPPPRRVAFVPDGGDGDSDSATGHRHPNRDGDGDGEPPPSG